MTTSACVRWMRRNIMPISFHEMDLGKVETNHLPIHKKRIVASVMRLDQPCCREKTGAASLSWGHHIASSGLVLYSAPCGERLSHFISNHVLASLATDCEDFTQPSRCKVLARSGQYVKPGFTRCSVDMKYATTRKRKYIASGSASAT